MVDANTDDEKIKLMLLQSCVLGDANQKIVLSQNLKIIVLRGTF